MEIDSMYLQNEGAKKVLFLPGWGQGINEEFIKLLGQVVEVLALTFPFSDPNLGDSKAWKMQDYGLALEVALRRYNYKPDIAIGHSFGGKILSFYSQQTNLLIAPSIFKPLFHERLKVWLKIRRNKIAHRFYKFTKKKIPSKYLGSFDHQRTSGLARKTFLAVKDSYLDEKKLLSIVTNSKIIAFSDDFAVPKRRILKRTKRIKEQIHFYRGTHDELYHNPLLLIRFLKENYELN